MNLESIFNNFITSGIKSPDPRTITKFKVLNIFLLILVLFIPIVGLFYFFIGADLLFYTTIIAGLLGVSVFVLLRKTKNLIVAGNYAFFVLWATLLIIMWNTGAMTEGSIILLSWIWNAVLILMAIFLTGYLWGTIWTTLIFAETGVTVYLFSSGYKFQNLIPPEISPVYSLGAYLSGLLVILLIAFLYEKEKTDVTESEQLKSRALVESKKYIDTIIDRSPLPTFVIDKEHRVIQWNRACQQMTGIPLEEIIGKKVHTSLHAESQQSLADIMIQDPEFIEERHSGSILKKTDSGFFEMKMPLPAIKGGIQAVISVAPILDINGSIKGAIETIQDVTNIKGGTYQIHDSVDWTVESQPNPMFKIDSKGKISYWDKACEENFGYPASQMIGKTPLSFVSKTSKKPFRDTIISVFKGNSFNGREWKYYSAKGEPVHVLAKAYPIQAIGGRPKECVIVNTDITDLQLRMKRLERDAAETREKLKSVTDDYALLRKNIATYIRKKEK